MYKYTKSGFQVFVEAEIGNRIFARALTIFTDDEYGHEFEGYGSLEEYKKEELFDTQPVEVLNLEIDEINKQIISKRNELKSIEHEVRMKKLELEQAQKTQISNEKFIINRTELLKANTITMFPSDSIVPITKDKNDKSFYGLKLSMEIKIQDGEANMWGYKLYHDYGDHSWHLDKRYGFFVDIPEEEAIRICKQRQSEVSFSDSQIMRTPDKWLTEKNLEKKQLILQNEEESKKEKLKEEIEKKQRELDKIKALANEK
ncbi:hypothetical protein ACR1PO_15575 [Chryseobacterium sp. RRHN12]|uniref:hypothetical protein n=1 Tax=Chryseobacterium sp. RRHN12 TaxID=3437884 RepID=UPI003D9BE762